MSSYVDANHRYLRGRYYAPQLSRGKRRRLKLGLSLGAVVIASLALIQGVYGGGRTGTDQVTVQQGDSVWSIASSRYPDDDTRGRVADIVRLNNLGGQPLYAGEKLNVPAR